MILRNSFCLGGAIVAGIGYGAYLNGNAMLGSALFLISVAIYIGLRVVR